MRRDRRFMGRLLRVRVSFEERNTGASSLLRGRGLPCRFRRGCEPVGYWTCCFRTSVAAITAGLPSVTSTTVPILTAERPVIVALNWHYWVTRGAASSRGTGSAIKKTQHWRKWRCGLLARCNRRAGYMTCGPRPPCWTAGCDKAERVHNRGAVACFLHGGTPFRLLVSARMGERL
jgi:hypothetical protein